MPGLSEYLDQTFGYNPIEREKTPLEAAPPATPVQPMETPASAPAPSPEIGTPPTEQPVSPSLRAWLLYNNAGGGTLDKEHYDYFGGDNLLKEMQQFDPNARWTLTDIGGGEGGPQGQGLRLDFDPSKLPAVGGPGGGRSVFDTGFVPVYDNSNLHDPTMVYDDPYYGKMTTYHNVVKEKPSWWTYAAPIAVSALAPWAAGALAGAGIGGAGLTAGVTGSGLSAAGGSSPWWASALSKAPQVARTIASGLGSPSYAPSASNGYATPPFNPDPAQAPDLYTGAHRYDPSAYNNMGSQPKPASNDSSLVATQFADDPYRFSS